MYRTFESPNYFNMSQFLPLFQKVNKEIYIIIIVFIIGANIGTYENKWDKNLTLLDSY